MVNIATLDDLLSPFEAHASLGEDDLLKYKTKPSVGISSPALPLQALESVEEKSPESHSPQTIFTETVESLEERDFDVIHVDIPPPPELAQAVSLGFAEDLLNVLTPEERHPEHALVKRVSEIIFAIVSLGLTAPLFAWVAFLSKSQAPESPVLVYDPCIGQFQQRITVPRFHILEDLNKQSSILLRLSKGLGLNHLPKLLSLYEGTLSLVGPALMREQDIQALQPKHLGRFQVLPGIFGFAQVLTKFYPDTSLRAKAQLDLEYIDRWSVFLDIAILWKHLTAQNPHKKTVRAAKAEHPRRVQITITY